MKVIIRKPDMDSSGNIVLREILENDILLSGGAIMAIDGSTTNTGVAILRKSDGAIFYSCSFAREQGETPVQYKVRLKRSIERLLKGNPVLDMVYYEEPFIGHITAIKNLMMLRTFVEEIIVENEPDLNYIQHYEINNMKWKRMFLAPDKCPPGTELQKKAVRAKLESYMPYISVVTQDEIDAISMGFVAANHIKNGTEDELEQKKKIHPFQYNIRFIGANYDDDMWTEFGDLKAIPEYPLQNGIKISDIPGTANFDKFVYQQMGADDKILVIKFPSDKHGNLILKYQLGNLSSNYEYIYAIIWRKSRKLQ